MIEVVASALLFFASYGLGEWWPLAWIAPVPVWIACWGPQRNRGWLAGVAYLLGSLNLATYFGILMPVPIVVAVLVLTALAFWGVTALADRCIRAMGHVVGAFAFPVFWGAFEWIQSQISPHGTAGSLSYSQVDFIPALQVASLTGAVGLTFLLLLIPSAIACFWISRRLVVLAVPGVLIASVLTYGFARQREPQGEAPLSVSLVASDQSVRYNRTVVEAEAMPVLAAYAKRVDAVAARGAKYALLPEKIVGIAPAYRDRAYRVLSEAASRNHVTVIAGVTLSGAEPMRNAAIVFGPRGEIQGTYEKWHMVPGFEDAFQPGSRTLVIDDYGVAIGKDFDFPSLTARYAGTVRVMFAPAWDFVLDAKLHGRMAVMRGVEHGFTLVRAANQGRLTISDPFGRILAETSTIGLPEASLVGAAPRYRIQTTYARWGDWFAVLCCGLSLVLIALLVLAKPPSRKVSH